MNYFNWEGLYQFESGKEWSIMAKTLRIIYLTDYNNYKYRKWPVMAVIGLNQPILFHFPGKGAQRDTEDF